MNWSAFHPNDHIVDVSDEVQSLYEGRGDGILRRRQGAQGSQTHCLGEQVAQPPWLAFICNVLVQWWQKGQRLQDLHDQLKQEGWSHLCKNWPNTFDMSLTWYSKSVEVFKVTDWFSWPSLFQQFCQKPSSEPWFGNQKNSDEMKMIFSSHFTCEVLVLTEINHPLECWIIPCCSWTSIKDQDTNWILTYPFQDVV